MPTNLEWQTAAFGTPDPGIEQANNCNVLSNAVANTGSRNLCVSDIGAYDMVGNLWEFVSDWSQGGALAWSPTDGSSSTTGSAYGNDYVAGVQPAGYQVAVDQKFGAAVTRGGGYSDAALAGVFAAYVSSSPAAPSPNWGFRCAK